VSNPNDPSTGHNGGWSQAGPGQPQPAPGHQQSVPGHPHAAPGQPQPVPGYQQPVPGHPHAAPGQPQPVPGYQQPVPGYPQAAPGQRQWPATGHPQPAYPPPPYAGQPPHQAGFPAQQGFPGQPPYGQPGFPGQQAFPGQPPRAKRRRGWLIGGGVGIVVVLAVAVGIVALRPSSSDTGGGSGSDAGTVLQPGQAVDAQALATVSPDAQFWSFFRRQIQAKIAVVTSSSFSTRESFAAGQFESIFRAGVDHAAKKPFLERTYFLAGKPESVDKCIDGAEQTYYLDDQRWTVEPPDRPETCTAQDHGLLFNGSDGVAPSGLSQTQADAYITALQKKFPGFVKAGKPTLLGADGRQYVRMAVDFGPVKIPGDGYEGNQIFIWAFKDTGLDGLSWPFTNGHSGATGSHVVYYLDTKTLLPAYSVVSLNPALDDNTGQPSTEDTSYFVGLFQYDYPDALPASTRSDTTPLTLRMPEGWKLAR
jgi:hypothetical protein